MGPDESRAAGNEHSHPPSLGRKSAARIAFFLALFLVSAAAIFCWRLWPEWRERGARDPAFQLPSPFFLASLPVAARFDFPLGNENGALAYNAQPFTQNNHLGDDLNGIGGENSDLGDPIFAVADGRVLFAGEGGPGWGKIVILLHALEENGVRRYVESYYAHCDSILVGIGAMIARGQQIATVGTGGGRYLAHLHFEMREFPTPFIGAGYRANTEGWINGSDFLAKHRLPSK